MTPVIAAADQVVLTGQARVWIGILGLLVIAGSGYFFWIALTRAGRLHAQRQGTRIGVLKPHQSTQNLANRVVGIICGVLGLAGGVVALLVASGAVQP